MINNVFYFFFSCYYHYHKNCPRYLIPEVHSEKAELKRACDRNKADYLRREGYSYNVMWQCEFEELLETDASARLFVESLRSVEDEEDFSPNRSCFSSHEKITNEIIFEKVKTGEFFGFLKIDAELNPKYVHLYEKYPVLIKREVITPAMLSADQQDLAKKLNKLPDGGTSESLIGVNKAEKYLVTGEHLAFLLSLPEDHITVSHVYLIAEYLPRRPLLSTIDRLVSLRRKADLDPDYALLGATAKLLANSLYGYVPPPVDS